MPFITVRHNIEVAHRLYELPGKCQNIHGHSMWVELTLYALLNNTGVAGGMEFGAIKSEFRKYLDGTFDHHLLLNETDPWAKRLFAEDDVVHPHPWEKSQQLPGLMAMPGDPTTEHLAKWIAEWAIDQFNVPATVIVHETSVNAAGYSAEPGGVEE
jgi:6-pyruvoyltetrahydropterin/6-carboxytetrahydropterin synthase